MPRTTIRPSPCMIRPVKSVRSPCGSVAGATVAGEAALGWTRSRRARHGRRRWAWSRSSFQMLGDHRTCHPAARGLTIHVETQRRHRSLRCSRPDAGGPRPAPRAMSTQRMPPLEELVNGDLVGGAEPTPVRSPRPARPRTPDRRQGKASRSGRLEVQIGSSRSNRLRRTCTSPIGRGTPTRSRCRAACRASRAERSWLRRCR